MSAIFLLICLQAKTQILGTAAIDSLAKNAIKKFNVPGMAVAVIKNGKIVHVKGYGVRSLNTGLPVDAEYTIWHCVEH